MVSMFAFWSIIMTSFGVNYYLSGLHSYAAGDPLPIPKFVYFLAAFMVIIAFIAYFRNRRSNIKNYYSDIIFLIKKEIPKCLTHSGILSQNNTIIRL